jgi:hypothetical protein
MKIHRKPQGREKIQSNHSLTGLLADCEVQGSPTGYTPSHPNCGGNCGGNFMAVITALELKNLTADKHGQTLRLGNSMLGVVRVATDGVISVNVTWRYRVGGQTREVHLGTWRQRGGDTLKALRDKREKLAAELRNKGDPIESKATERLKKQADQAAQRQAQLNRLQEQAAQSARMTVKELFDLWRELALKRRKDGGAEALRAFERDVFPTIGAMAVADVTKAHIQQIVDKMMARDVLRMTKRVLSDLRQLFCFALDRDHIQADPTARIKKASLGKDTERDRVLTEREVMDLLDKLPRSGLSQTAQIALRIQLSTLARIGEVVAARWDHVDFERRIWTLPDTKNGKAHRVYLSGFALAQFL